MFSLDSLNMLPSGALAAISDFFTSKAEDEAAALSSEKARKDRLEGKAEVNSVTNGKVVTTLKNTLDSIDKYAGLISSALATAKMIKNLTDAGEEPFQSGSVGGGTTVNQGSVDTLNQELDTQLSPQTKPEISQQLELQKSMSNSKISSLQTELNQSLETLDQVNDVLAKRATGELPNPVVNVSAMDSALNKLVDDFGANLAAGGNLSTDLVDEIVDSFRNTLQRTANTNLDNYEKFIVNKLAVPYSENRAALDIIKAQLLGIDVEDEEEPPIFDTVFGPPVSSKGRYILSEDGIYYDSRSGSIPHITARQIDSMSWQLRYESNRGGQGQAFTDKDAARFADSILSFDYQNETQKVKDFYKYDDILQNMVNDRELQVADVSGKIADLITKGYTEDSAVVQNYKESYAAVAHTYDRKIKKRKKQLQVAALFGPYDVTTSGDPRGEGLFYRIFNKAIPSFVESICGEPNKVETISFGVLPDSSEIEFIPRIPVNDFRYLKELGLIPEIESQKKVMLHSSDLDDTTAPITPIFLEQGPGEKYEAIPELSIGPYGTADWLNTSGATASALSFSSTISGITPYLRTLDDDIVTDNLVVCYNFLEPHAAVTPSSNEFLVKNYADKGHPLNAKLVGDASEIFLSGVTIPYLTGSLYRPDLKYGLRYSHLPKGSYVRLPNNYRNNTVYTGSQPIDDLMYNKQGWSIDFWAYTPDLYDGMTVDHRYKIVAANENCGDPITRTSTTSIFTTADSDPDTYVVRKGRTRGMIIGWRDRGEPGTDVSEGLEFVVLPTVAQNNDKWGKSVLIAEEVSGMGTDAECRVELGFKVDTSVTTESGYTIEGASTEFTHYGIVCDPGTDTISLYVNGEFLASSLVSTSFSTNPGSPISIPTKITDGHYHERVPRYGESLYAGELPEVPIFTPWILGGGFTDGIADSPFTKQGAVPLTTVPGFLGTNTNSSYYVAGSYDSSGGPIGQHSVLTPGSEVAGLGGFDKVGANHRVSRSGLDGHLGSFKMYSKPLSNNEVSKNYKAQSPYFGGIERPHRLI